MRRTIGLFIFIILIFISSNAMASPKIIINGELMEYETLPVIIDGRVLVPIKDIFKTFNLPVDWDDELKMVRATKNNRSIILLIGSSYAFVDGAGVILTVPPQIINGRTMVPLRFISEVFDSSVDWNSMTETVTIESKELQDKKFNITENSKPIVKIICDTKNGMIEGNGIIIRSDGYIITNYHNIKDMTSGKIILNNNQESSFEVANTNIEYDLAILKISSKDLPTANIGNSDSIEINEQLYAVGYNSEEIQPSSGSVEAMTSENGYQYFTMNTPLKSHNSGCGLYDSSGYLVGVMTGAFDQDHSLAIPINEVSKYILGSNTYNLKSIVPPFILDQEVSLWTLNPHNIKIEFKDKATGEYSQRFPLDVDWVTWELSFDFSKQEKLSFYKLKEVYYTNARGNEIKIDEYPIYGYLNPGWTETLKDRSIGLYRLYGSGSYRVEIYADGKLLVSGTYEMYNAHAN